MLLTVSGSSTIKAPQAFVWKRVMDADAVAACAPGVQSVEAVDDRHYRVVSALGVGSIKLKFAMDVELADVVEPEQLAIVARGQAPGSAVKVSTSLRLESLSGKETALRWKADADFSGTIASVGARLLQGTAKKLTEKFWRDFARETEKAAKTARR